MDTKEKQNSSLTIIDKFDGKYRFLSNFWPVELFYDDVHFPSVEHAYQAAKTLDPDLRHKISQARTPGEAKRLGRLTTLRSDWELVKFQIMTDLVYDKFLNTELNILLLNTDTAYLEEGNTWHDNYWGVCRCGKCSGGKNALGFLLMVVRRTL
jgi:hypothetical protein